MNKIRFWTLALVLAISTFVICDAQQNFLTLAAIFGTGPAGQVIVSNASGNPIATVAGGGLTYNLTVEVAAGAGTTVADATALSAAKFVHQLTGADGTKGWKFASTTTGNVCHVMLNTTAGVAKIYGNTGGTVNGGSVDAAFSALTGIKPIICCSTGTDTWLCA